MKGIHSSYLLQSVTADSFYMSNQNTKMNTTMLAEV